MKKADYDWENWTQDDVNAAVSFLFIGIKCSIYLCKSVFTTRLLIYDAYNRFLWRRRLRQSIGRRVHMVHACISAINELVQVLYEIHVRLINVLNTILIM